MIPRRIYLPAAVALVMGAGVARVAQDDARIEKLTRTNAGLETINRQLGLSVRGLTNQLSEARRRMAFYQADSPALIAGDLNTLPVPNRAGTRWEASP
jgi:hypothetical protein